MHLPSLREKRAFFPDISRDAKNLFLHRMFVSAALAALSTFSVIFLYEYFDTMLAVFLAYGALYVLTFILTPLSARLLRWYGLRSLIMVAVPFLALEAYILSYLSAHTAVSFGAFVVGLSVLFSALYKALYWVPYQVDMTQALSGGATGQKVAFMGNAADLIVLSMPLLGGLLVTSSGFPILFALGATLIVVSILPLFSLSDRYEYYSWGYVQTFRMALHPRTRTLLFSYVGDGIQAGALAIVWPLAIFLLVGKEYETVGAVATLTLLSVLLLRSTTGLLFDRWEKERVIWWGALLSSTGWLLKVFVATPVHIVAVDTYHGLGHVVNRTSVDAMTYEQAADNGRYVDEYTVLKEMALNAGRVVLLLIAGLAFLAFGPEAAVFASVCAAAVATLFTALLARRISIGVSGE